MKDIEFYKYIHERKVAFLHDLIPIKSGTSKTSIQYFNHYTMKVLFISTYKNCYKGKTMQRKSVGRRSKIIIAFFSLFLQIFY